MIAALFVQRDGCYWDLPDVDPWDEERDARLYAGPWPVVAHPPCARWCLLAGLVEARYGYKRGDDGGCFSSALESVRKWGGVLEHPAWTHAWPAHGLPAPNPRGGWLRTFCGGWVCHVDQGHYGHRARKPTWLYTTVKVPPVLKWGKSADSSAAVSLGFSDTWKRRKGGEVQLMSKRQRSATPLEFRTLLLEMAAAARGERGVTPG